MQQDTGNDIERAFNAKSDTKTIRTAQNRRHGQKHTAFLFTVPFYIKQAYLACNGHGVTQQPAYSVFDSILLIIVRNNCPLVKRKSLSA